MGVGVAPGVGVGVGVGVEERAPAIADIWAEVRLLSPDMAPTLLIAAVI